MSSHDASQIPSKRRRISVTLSPSYRSNESPDKGATLPIDVDQNSNEIDAGTPTLDGPGLKQVAKTISNLDEKCLKHIFNYLQFRDLLNAANATKKFRETAREIYTERYADKVVKYNGDAVIRKGLETDVTDTTIEINDARSCLKMLQGFGTLIKSLKLNFDGIGPKRMQAISLAVNEFCSQTLIKLIWQNCPKNAMQHATKKFTKLQQLQIVSGSIGDQMSRFAHFFPVLKALEIADVELADRKCIERTMPSLSHLKLKIESKKGMDFLKSNVKAALNLNPHLTSFSIIYGCDVTLLKYIEDKLPKLETLEIQNPRNKFFDGNEDRVVFIRVKNFILDITNSNDSFTNIPFAFRRLREFTLNACAPHRDKWIDFAVQNKNLVALKLLNYHWFYTMQKEQLTKIAGLTKLSNLVLDWRVASNETVSEFMDQCKNLQRLRLSLRTRLERAAICAEIGNEWQTEIDEHFLTFERNPDLILD